MTPTTTREHETELHCAGTWYSWSCTCGKKSRHHAPLHLADRNAKAHERKYTTPTTKGRR